MHSSTLSLTSALDWDAWTPGPVCTDAVNLGLQDSIPGPTSRSKSLYRLNYPGPHFKVAPAALSPGRGTPGSTTKESAWTPEAVWKIVLPQMDPHIISLPSSTLALFLKQHRKRGSQQRELQPTASTTLLLGFPRGSRLLRAVTSIKIILTDFEYRPLALQ
jgi:hypothetical protein